VKVYVSSRKADVCKSVAGELAQAFGGYGERVSEPSQIVPAIGRGIEATRNGTPAPLEFLTSKEIEISKV